MTYVAALSLWALVSGHWSAWQAARVEVNQQHEAEQRDREGLPGEIVERMVHETDVPAELDPERAWTRPLQGKGSAWRSCQEPTALTG